MGDLLQAALPVAHGRPVQLRLEDQVGVVHDSRGVLVLCEAGEDDEAESDVVVSHVRLGVLHGDGDIFQESHQEIDGLDTFSRGRGWGGGRVYDGVGRVGFCLIVTATIIGHAVGDLQISMLELTSDVMAVVMFCAVGIIGVAHSKLSQIIN